MVNASRHEPRQLICDETRGCSADFNKKQRFAAAICCSLSPASAPRAGKVADFLANGAGPEPFREFFAADSLADAANGAGLLNLKLRRDRRLRSGKPHLPRRRESE